MRALVLALLIGSAHADEPQVDGSEATEEPDSPARGASALPGTVDNPIRVRLQVLDGDTIGVDRAWRKVNDALLGLEDAVVTQLDTHLKGPGFDGRRVRVEVSRDLHVDIEPVEASGRLRVQVTDGAGEAVPVDAAWIDITGEPTPLQLAGPGEVVIEEVHAYQGVTVQLHTTEGDVVVLWLEEGESTVVDEAPAPE